MSEGGGGRGGACPSVLPLISLPNLSTHMDGQGECLGRGRQAGSGDSDDDLPAAGPAPGLKPHPLDRVGPVRARPAIAPPGVSAQGLARDDQIQVIDEWGGRGGRGRRVSPGEGDRERAGTTSWSLVVTVASSIRSWDLYFLSTIKYITYFHK